MTREFLPRRSVLIAGATGLVGKAALTQASVDPRFDRVIALMRRPLPPLPKVEQWLAREESLLSGLRSEHVDAVICCLGTTIKTAGSKAAFRHVDYDLVVGLGRWAKAQGVPVFCVVSSIGADPSSRVFYSRVKGEMEQALAGLGLRTLYIFHPSILTGPRVERRLGERIGIAVMRFFAPVLPKRYRPMPHDVLAQALINATGRDQGGVYTFEAINRLAAG